MSDPPPPSHPAKPARKTNVPPVNDTPATRITPPPAFLTDPALATLLTALPRARVVGGAVRDALAQRPVADIDLATPLPPAEVMAALRRAGIRVVPTGLAHGTVTAVLNHLRGDHAGGRPDRHPGDPLSSPPGIRTVEITTLRRDVTTDGRHATVAFTDDWRQDAARRDFTINAMSMTRDGAVYDYFGGIADLRAGVLRFVGDPAQRIAEDTLRVLRYFRFFARYAAIPPDPAVRTALHAGVAGFPKLSAERVWSELLRILAAPAPAAAVALMAELGVLAAVIPEGADPAALARLLAAGAPADPLLRLAALLTGEVNDFADRLHLSAAERQRLLELQSTPLARPQDDDATLRRLLADHPRAALVDRTWLYPAQDPLGLDPLGLDPLGLNAALPANPADPRWAALRARLETLPAPIFPLEGRDVLALGVPPGPRVGALLRVTRAWWLAGGCTASVEDCRAELTRALARSPDPPTSPSAGPPTSPPASLPSSTPTGR